MEYQIVRSDNHLALTIEVNFYIERGWKPLGGVSVAVFVIRSSFYTYIQAMTKDN